MLYWWHCYNTNDFDEIYELTYEKFEDEAIPKEYVDMSNDTYKRMLKLWEIACKNSPIVNSLILFFRMVT